MTMAQKTSPVSPTSAPLDFTVSVVACGPLTSGEEVSMVYAVGVVQPVQSWTVLRSHDDFAVLSQSLGEGQSPCPAITDFITDGHVNPPNITRIRDSVQEWLTNVLVDHPQARSSTPMRIFLTQGANTVLPQYEGVTWTLFPGMAPHATPTLHNFVGIRTTGHVDDMEMDDMFVSNNDDDSARHGEMEEEQEEKIPTASERYKPKYEAVTDQDELDILQGDVEMIEDIGSLAQSMGASHLGRSLKLQAEMTMRNQLSNVHSRGVEPTSPRALNIRGSPTLGVTDATGQPQTAAAAAAAAGGLSGAMAQAASNDAFKRKAMESAPRLDSFKMISVIGKGSFGKVFLVREHNTDTMYALKVLRKDNIIKRNQVEHTKTERSVLGYVQHPFIVGMNMAFQSKDKLYFVLDYCAGGELFFHLGKEGKFQEPRAMFYAAEIVLAISYVHSLDIIYRDLKPENVLLDSQGHIRLTDFGLSKEGISNSSSGANSFCGTPEYLAPEILNRQGHGRAVDWWSLGALLYEMLTGLPPFYCQDRERLFEKIRKSELTYPVTLSRPSVGLLKGLLTKDPTARLGSGPNDADDIKPHEFFSPINWDKLMRGEVTPPWRPNIKGCMDTSHFDTEFTSMTLGSPVTQPHHIPGSGSAPGDNHFEGFTFTTDRILHGPRAH